MDSNLYAKPSSAKRLAVCMNYYQARRYWPSLLLMFERKVPCCRAHVSAASAVKQPQIIKLLTLGR